MPNNRMKARHLHLVPCLLLALGCVTTGGTADKPTAFSDSQWVQPSASLATDIAVRAEALPWTHGRDRVDLISWFAMVGEPAYDTLLAFMDDDRPEVVATALAALGATADSRLVPTLRAAEKPEWSPVLKLENARTLVRLGDWEAMPILIDGLENEDHFKRALCAQALFNATRENNGFDPAASLPEREAAVARWRSWWQQRSEDSLLISQL